MGKEDAPKVIQVVTDGTAIMQKTSALHTCPDPQECARGLAELDEEVLSVEAMENLIQHACPEDHEFALLQFLKEKHPTVPLAIPEQYMWVFGQVKRAKEKLNVWMFTRAVADEVEVNRSKIADFKAMCEGIQNSTALKSVFGFILGVGNYMNGGTGRGRYDAFYVDKTLEQLANCKETKSGKGSYTLATFVLRHLVEQEPDVWENLIDDMTPLFLNVSRRIKQVEGADFLNRNNKVNIADYEGIVTAIDKNCKNYKKTLESILKEIPDNDKDPFKLTMPVMFAKAEAAVNELVKLREKTQEDYKKMLKQLNMESSLKADDFCMMWDKFLVPEGLILAFDPQQRSKFI